RVAPDARSRDGLLIAHAAGTAAKLGEGYTRLPGAIAVAHEPVPDPATSPFTYRLWVGDGADRRPAGAVVVPTGGFLNLVSADGRTAVAVAGTDEFHVWDLSDPDAPRRTATLTQWPFPQGIDAAGTLLTAVENGGAVHWRPGDTTRARLAAEGVEDAMPLDDGSGVVLARRVGDHREVEVWHLDGRVTPVVSRSAEVTLTTGPNGMLAVSDDGRLTVFDLDGGPRVVVEGAVPERAVVEFSRDGSAVGAAYLERVWFWDLTGGRQPLALRSPGVDFSGARFEPADGDLLLLESRTGAMWRLAVDVDRVVREVCADPADVDWAAHFPGLPARPLCP
ncbi:MAG: hypothetical protein HOV94_24545, partial [Saccharothrix sp.]|nr:hypothetical protein [Saccharothrix sp.]